MRFLDALQGGIQSIVAAGTDQTRQREELDEAEEQSFVVHISDLGKCPIYLYYKMAGLLPPQAAGGENTRPLFLADGHWFESRSAAIIQCGLPHELVLLHNTPQVQFEQTLPGADTRRTTRLVIRGTPDLVLQERATGTILEVLEHKALGTKNFKLYSANPALIPVNYVHQLAGYVTLLEARDGGLILLRCREDGNFFPPGPEDVPGTRFTLQQCQEIFRQDVAQLLELTEGKVPERMPWTRECDHCVRRGACHGQLPTTTERGRTVYTIPPEDPDGVAGQIARAKELTQQIDALESAKAEATDYLSRYLQSHGLNTIVGPVGRASWVCRRPKPSLTAEGKDRVNQMMESGELPTQIGQEVWYVDVR